MTLYRGLAAFVLVSGFVFYVYSVYILPPCRCFTGSTDSYVAFVFGSVYMFGAAAYLGHLVFGRPRGRREGA